LLQHILLVGYVLIQGRVEARGAAAAAATTVQSGGQESQLAVLVAILHIDAGQTGVLILGQGLGILLRFLGPRTAQKAEH